MALRRCCRVPLAILLGVFLSAGCGGGKRGIDYGWGEEDIPEGDGWEDVSPDSLRVTILSPTPGVDRIVSGPLDIKVRVDDPMALPVTLSFAYSKGMIADPVVRELDGPGEATVTIDTAAVVGDGRTRRLIVTAESENGRTASADLRMVVDNHPPTVTAVDPTPQPGGNFMGELVLRFEVSDPGTGVTQVVVRVEDFQYVWPTSGTSSGEAEVDTGEIVIPTVAWASGDKKVTVEARDGLQTHLTTQEIPLGFIRSPQFLGGDTRALPDEFSAGSLAGVRLGLTEDHVWGVVVAGSAGIRVVTRNAQNGRLVRRAELLKTGVAGVRVRDVNRDDLDDIVAWGKIVVEGEQQAVLFVFLQTADGMFFPPIELALPYPASDLAIGDFSGDGLPDFAMVMDHPTQTLGVIASDDSGAEPGWGAAATYAGAVKPTRVAIGDFAGVSQPGIVLTRSDSAIVTVFPVESGGVPSGGRNSTIVVGDEAIDGVAALGGVRFDGDASGRADRLIAADEAAGRILVIRRESGPGDPARVTLDTSKETGLGPVALAVADFDGDGISDLAVLCKGGNLVHTFRGGASGLANGPAFAVGNAQGLTTADLDGDGYLDVVVLDREGDRLTWLRYDPDVGGFQAAPMALLGFMPRSLALGRFTRSLPGKDAMLDAAVLGQDDEGAFRVVIKAADGVSGMPLLDTTPSPVVESVSPVGLIAANVNRTATADGGPDDILVTTNMATPFTTPKPATAEVLLFSRDLDSHTTIVSNRVALGVKDRPRLMAVADLDRAAPGESTALPYYSVVDLAVLEEMLEADTDRRYTRLQPYIGQGNGQFLISFREGPEIDAARNLQQVVAATVRRSLKDTLEGIAKDYDLVTVNAATGDLTVFVNERLGAYSEARSKDFAVGAGPRALAIGFMENRVRPPASGGTLDPNAAEILPDLVTLLANDVVISYSFDNALSLAQSTTAWSLLDYEPPVSLGHEGRSAVGVALADMNGDDYLDILLLNQGDATLSIYVNLANRKFSPPFDFPVGVGSAQMVVGDVNGDGCPDVVTADQGGQTLTVLRNMVACTPL